VRLGALTLCLVLGLGTMSRPYAQIAGSDSSSRGFYSAENIRRFADYLREQKDFLRAASEYDRLRFLIGPSPLGDSVLFLSGVCYLRGGSLKSCGARMDQLQNSLPQSPLLKAARYYSAWAEYSEKRWPEVIKLAVRPPDGPVDTVFDVHLRSLLCLSLARIGNWAQAESLACIDPQADLNVSESRDLCGLVRRGESLPKKSRWKAGLLSVVLPGSGKYYAGRKLDGAFSLITVGTIAWQSWRGFHNDGSGSVTGWLLGSFAVGLYLGNIYGATVSVEIYNSRLERDYFSEWESRLPR
jgi:hypothetical protein